MTELVWAAKLNEDGLHDKQSRYTFGAGNEGTLCSFYKADKTFCNTDNYIARVNQEGLCGSKDWRLPTVTELDSIVNFGSKPVYIDTEYFPYTVASNYWTSTVLAGNQEFSWRIDFASGETYWQRQNNALYVRLVHQ